MSRELINVRIEESVSYVNVHDNAQHHHHPLPDGGVFPGAPSVTVGNTAPVSPRVGDLWIDTN